MAELPWFRFFPSDWLGGTRAMSAAETGIYITLIATMYEKGVPIANDPVKLARLCGASNSTFRAALESLIDSGKITETDNGLWNERVGKEVFYRLEKSRVGSKAAKRKWELKANEINAPDDATAMPEQSDRNAILRSQISDTRKKEDTPLPPKGERAVKDKSQDEGWFDEAIRYDYPKKSARLPALRAWLRLSKADKMACASGVVDFAMRFDEKMKTAARPRSEELRFVPDLSTFINQRRWELEKEIADEAANG